MNIPEATVKEPLKFFQWLSEEQNFRNYKKNFFEQIIDNNPVSNFNKDEITYWGIDYNGNDIYIKANFEEKLHKIFDRELFIAKKNIDDAINTMLFNGNPPSEFLSYIQEILKGIRTSSEKISNYYPYHPEEAHNLLLDDYPFINEIFIQLDNYITRKQSMFSKNKENLSEANVASLQEINSDKEDKYSVIKTLVTFKDKMESEKEYNRLIKHVTDFIETKKLPTEQFRKFKPFLNIKKEDIRFKFFELYKANKNRINRHNYCDFIILSFDDFSNVTERYLYSKLSDKALYSEL